MNAHTISIRFKSESLQTYGSRYIIFISTTYCINFSQYNILSNVGLWIVCKSTMIQSGLSVLISRPCMAVALRNGTALKTTVSVMKQDHLVEKLSDDMAACVI